MRLSDSIESFIKTLLTQEEPEVELKRNELAEYFGCAPSQINYVLATRFSPDHGYIIESRRGGGGYIRIVRVVQSGAQRLMYLANERIGEAITEAEIRLLGTDISWISFIKSICRSYIRFSLSRNSENHTSIFRIKINSLLQRKFRCIKYDVNPFR